MGQDRIIFPLDIETEAAAWQWCNKLRGQVGLMKVGLQLYTKLGPRALVPSWASGFPVMLDLKLHDIPNTVGMAVKSAVSNGGVRFITVHASGGETMMRAAVDAAGSEATILAITALTSLAAHDTAAIYGADPQTAALKLAKVAYKGGARGFVCSPHEVAKLKEHFPDAVFVVPGIRPAGSDANDQKRAATPRAAVAAGADYLVIGRPIRNAENPPRTCFEIGATIADQLIRSGRHAATTDEAPGG